MFLRIVGFANRVVKYCGTGSRKTIFRNKLQKKIQNHIINIYLFYSQIVNKINNLWNILTAYVPGYPKPISPSEFARLLAGFDIKNFMFDPGRAGYVGPSDSSRTRGCISDSRIQFGYFGSYKSDFWILVAYFLTMLHNSYFCHESYTILKIKKEKLKFCYLKTDLYEHQKNQINIIAVAIRTEIHYIIIFLVF